MPDGRGARFALEAVFLVAVAAVLAFSDLDPVWIVVVMLVAWAVVALLEWAAWRERPHWASGSPPRYYVPQEPLPPRPPSTELPAFTAYPRPEVRETESPTWIATPAMREELLGWPAPPPQEQPTTVEELPDELLAEAAGAGWPDAFDAGANGDPWEAVELPAEPEPEHESDNLLQAEEAADPPEAEAPAEASDESSQAGAVADAPDNAGSEPISDDSSQVEEGAAAAESVEADAASDNVSQADEPVVAAAPRAPRHRIDPFAEANGRRWPWTRRGEESAAVAELPPLPRHARILPREEER